MRYRRHLTYDEIWGDLWDRIQSQVELAGGLRRNDRNSPGERGPLPVTPNRPNTLSGGAAAALEFDD